MKDIPYGFVACDECDGKGVGVYSCCTGERITGLAADYMMCPICKEHLGEDDCEACDGTGYVVDEAFYKISKDLARNEREFKEDKQNNFL